MNYLKSIFLILFFLIFYSSSSFANVFTGGTATADTVSATNTADKALDVNVDTRWLSTNTALPHWWKYDFGAGNTRTIVKYRMDNTSGGGDGAKDWTFQGSNDDTNWTTLDTRTGITSPGWRGWYSIGSPAAYRYYRVHITATNDPNWVYIWEIEAEEASVIPGFFMFF